MKHTLTIFLLLLVAACSSTKEQIKTIDTFGLPDANGNKRLVATETIEYVSSKTLRTREATKTDVAASNAISQCWNAQSVKNSVIQTPAAVPSGLKGTELAMFMMGNMATESVRAMAQAFSSQNQVNPCPEFPTNVNDVAIEEAKQKTERSKALGSNIVKGVLGVGAVALGINSQNTTRDISVAGVNAVGSVAAAGISRAGNQTTINGDNNNSNTTSQDADNGSTISESGNYNPDSSSVVNNGESGEPVDPTNPGVTVVDAATCTEAGYTVRDATQEEIDGGTTLIFDVGGTPSACSTGDGGTVQVPTA